MKKFILGCVLLFCGFLGVLTLVCISIFEHWNYEGITGFRGFLLGSGTTWFFLAFCLLGLAGLAIAVYEAYSKELKWFFEKRKIEDLEDLNLNG